MSYKNTQELLEFYTSYMESLPTGDMESLLGHMSEETIMYPPGQPSHRGLETIRKQQSQKLVGIRVLDWGHTVDRIDVSESGDLGYVAMGLTHTIEMGGKTHFLDNKGVKVFKKVGGDWSLVIDIWNNNPSKEA